MNIKSIKNGIAATVIGASTLGGTLVKVPGFEVRQAQKAVAEAVQQVKKCQTEFTKDSIAFTRKNFKTAADSAAFDESRRAVISAETEKVVKDFNAAHVETYSNGKKSNLIEAAFEDGAYAVYQCGKNLTDKTKQLYNKLIK